MSQEIENTEVEEVELDEVVESDEEQEDVEEGTDEGEEIDYKAKYEEAEAAREKAEAAIMKAKSKSKPKAQKNISNSGESDRLDRLELKLSGYPEEVVEEIMNMGGVKALDNKIFKKAADDMKKQHQTEVATDITSGPKSAVSKKYSDADLEKMSAEELEKILPHAD